MALSLRAIRTLLSAELGVNPDIPRFMPGDPELDPLALYLIDFGFWLENRDDILDWVRSSDIRCVEDGVSLRFGDECDLMAFRLAWG